MNDEPTVDELKEQENLIEVEEDMPGAEEAKEEVEDVTAALRDLGRQFAETIQTAWNSQERREFERDVREGVRQFGDEVQKVLGEIKESQPARKVKEEAGEARTRVQSGEVTRKVRLGVVDGLQWLSQELARLAEQFSPPEKAAADIEVDVTPEDEA